MGDLGNEGSILASLSPTTYTLGQVSSRVQCTQQPVSPTSLQALSCKGQEPGADGAGTITGEGDIKMHCCVAAYISDYAFLSTALLPHHCKHKAHFMASLDHSMWFHAPFRADHWMLYECESPWAGECGATWDMGTGLGVAGSLLSWVMLFPTHILWRTHRSLSLLPL